MVHFLFAEDLLACMKFNPEYPDPERSSCAAQCKSNGNAGEAACSPALALPLGDSSHRAWGWWEIWGSVQQARIPRFQGVMHRKWQGQMTKGIQEDPARAYLMDTWAGKYSCLFCSWYWRGLCLKCVPQVPHALEQLFSKLMEYAHSYIAGLSTKIWYLVCSTRTKSLSMTFRGNWNEWEWALQRWKVAAAPQNCLKADI